MIQDNSRGYRVFRVANGLLLSLLTFAAFYPMYFVVIASFSDGNELVKNVGALWAPLKPYTVDAYERVFANRNIATGYQNTLFVLAVGVPLNVILTTMGAYFLSLKNMRMGGVIMFLILFTRYFSGGMVPSFLLIRSLDLMNTRWSVILSCLLSTYYVVLVTNFIRSLPGSLLESARLDGASEATILVRIVLPLSKPILATITVMNMISLYGDFIWPLLVIDSNSIQVISVAVQTYSSSTQGSTANYGAMIAGFVMATIPLLVMFLFSSRLYIEGITSGAVKA